MISLLQACAVPPLSLFSAAPGGDGDCGCFPHFSYSLVGLLPDLSLSSLDQHPALRADLVALFLILYSPHLESTAGRRSKGEKHRLMSKYHVTDQRSECWEDVEREAVVRGCTIDVKSWTVVKRGGHGNNVDSKN